jgi:protease-4
MAAPKKDRVPFSVWLRDTWRNLWLRLGNFARRRSRRPLDYVVIDLEGSLPEYIPPPPWWHRYVPSLFDLAGQPDGPSLAALRYILERVSLDPRTRGAILRLERFSPAGWATACSVRDIITRFRQSGKRVVVYSDEFSTVSYYVASAADEILLPPGGGWNVYGLRVEAAFIKDALDAVGVQAEVLNVAPYKAAGDMFSRSDMSPEHREMLTWILDGQYDELINSIAESRTLSPDRVRELVDTAPKLSPEALEAGLVDGVCYFDEVAERLYVAPPEGKRASRGNATLRRWWARLRRQKPEEEKEAEAQPKTARLLTWSEAYRQLVRPVRWRSGKTIGIVTLEGTIAPGESQRLPVPIPLPFVGRAVAGSESVAQALRRVEKDDSAAAVVFYVDSRGGSATDSNLIWREVERVRRKKPVVVCMANVAASGGYYVAAGADRIFAQPLTLTGSIGVVLMKFIISGLYERLRTHQVTLKRGARAGLFSSDEPFGEVGRPVAQGIVDEFYRQFREVVTGGRKLSDDALDTIAGGRVWLGKQALDLGLVDEMGDLWAAVQKAKELGKVRADRYTPAVWFGSGRGGLLPAPFPAQKPAAWLEALWALSRQRVWMIWPVEVEIK